MVKINSKQKSNDSSQSTLALILEDRATQRKEMTQVLKQSYGEPSEVYCYDGAYKIDSVCAWIETQLKRAPLFQNTCLFVDLSWGSLTVSEKPYDVCFIPPQEDTFLKCLFCPENILMRISEEELVEGLAVVQKYAFRHLRRFYIVVISGFGMDRFKAFAQKIGADHVIQKYPILEKLFADKEPPSVRSNILHLKMKYIQMLESYIETVEDELYRTKSFHFTKQGQTKLNIDFTRLSKETLQTLHRARCLIACRDPDTQLRLGVDSKCLEADIENWSNWMLSAPNRYSKQYFVETSLSFQTAHNQLPFLGESSHKLAHEIAVLAPSNLSILIQGEAASGKQILARQIHQASLRAASPFVVLSGSSLKLSERKSEAELKIQHFVKTLTQAKKATLYLSRIDRLSFEEQNLLLSYLQDESADISNRQAERSTRLISSTNSNLSSLIEQGKFLPELYYYIAEYIINISPLAARLDDFPEIIQYLLKEIATKEGTEVVSYEPEIISHLQFLNWETVHRGGVKEMQNLLLAAIMRMRLLGAGKLLVEHLKFAVSLLTLTALNQPDLLESNPLLQHSPAVSADLLSLSRKFDSCQKVYKDILYGLVSLGELGKISQHDARRMLGFKSVVKLDNKLKEFGLKNPWSRGSKDSA